MTHFNIKKGQKNLLLITAAVSLILIFINVLPIPLHGQAVKNGSTNVGANSSSGDYVPLAPIGNYITANTAVDLSRYLRIMFQLGIAIASALAVIMVVIGGIEYMSTDAINGKSEGKEKIISALWGLVLALASYMILSTINTQLLNTNPNFNGENVPGINAPGSSISNNPTVVDSYRDSDGLTYTNYSNGYTKITLPDGITSYYLDPSDNLQDGPCPTCHGG
jgi:hypothetical protein